MCEKVVAPYGKLSEIVLIVFVLKVKQPTVSKYEHNIINHEQNLIPVSATEGTDLD